MINSCIITSTWKITLVYTTVEYDDFHFTCNSLTFAGQALSVTVAKLWVLGNSEKWSWVHWKTASSCQPMITFVTIWSHLVCLQKWQKRGTSVVRGKWQRRQAFKIINNHVTINSSITNTISHDHKTFYGINWRIWFI